MQFIVRRPLLVIILLLLRHHHHVGGCARKLFRHTVIQDLAFVDRLLFFIVLDQEIDLPPDV